MPKHRRRKNQRNRNNKGNNGNNKQLQQQHQEQQQEQQFGGEQHFGESSQVTTGTNPDLEEVVEEAINCERKETITERSQLNIKDNNASDDYDDEGNEGSDAADDNGDESKIANDKLNICEVTESDVYDAHRSSSKTGSNNSREDKAPSEERTELVQNVPADDPKGHLHESPTSTSLASTSSDSDTIKADELTPDRELDSFVSLDSHDLSDVTKSDKAPLTPIKHPIVHEVITTSYSYRVESPKPIKIKPPTRQIKKSRSLDDDDLMIQEISDNSSAGDLTDNQPLVSEAESEGDLDGIEPLENDDSRILSIQTLPLETTEDDTEKQQELTSTTNADQNSTSSEDFKVRRAKKRAAIETHFMPQFLNPRYLDSIKEENSDISDIEKKSGDSFDGLVHQRSSSSITDNDLEDDVFLDNEPITKKANAVFPKINLDFTQQRKKRGSNLRSPKADVIREESPCYVVEAKIFEQDSIEESCSTWTMKEAPESGAAEIVFIDSASSSSSDIMDLDETGGDDADVEDFLDDQEVRIETPTINGIIGENGIFTNSPTPTREGHTTEKRNDDEIINRRPPPVDCESEAIVENSANDHILEISPIGDGSILEQSRSKVGEAKMENLDKEFDKVLSDNQLIDLVTDLDASSGSECDDSKTRSTTVESSPERVFDILMNCDNNNLEYSRQNSNSSHGSGQSQSTVHSQCTAINKGSLSGHDLDGFDIAPCISGSSIDQQSTTLETAPKTLRQLCIEELTSMPYGKDVLEELAVVSESLSYLTKQHQEARKKSEEEEIEDMPYPIPELPRIEDLQVPGSNNNNNVSEPIHIKLVSTLKSPSPPPIPEPPEDTAWFGLPTEDDPKVLVCLSPSQRNYMQETNTINEKSAASLLDMHNKFVERRGYHELTTEQLNAINREKSQINEKIVSSTKLRNNSTTPPPIPPPPQNFNPLTLNENEISTDDNNDKNNHRLLAIIRDSTQSTTTSPQTSEIISKKIEKLENKTQSTSVVNNSRSEQETQTDIPIKATKSTVENVESTKKVSSDKSNSQPPQQHQPASTEMPQSQFEKDFMEYLEKGNPFKDEFKRSSAHIETTPQFCSQLSQTRPKRYSNIETSTYESKKRIENGNVIYDLCNSDKQKFTDTSDCDKNVFNIGTTNVKEKEHLKSNINLDARATTINAGDEVTTKTTTEAPKSPKDQFFSQNYKNRKNFDTEKKKSSDNFSYNEFRQRAKEAAEKARNEFFARENLLKDFDDISSVLKDDMFTTETTKSSKATTDHFSSTKSYEKNSQEWQEFNKKSDKRTESSNSINIPVNIERNVGRNSDGGWKEFGTNINKKSEYEERKKEEKTEVSSKVYDIPIKIQGKTESTWEELNKKLSESKKQESNEQNKVRNVPIQILKQEQKSKQNNSENQKEIIIPIQIESKQKTFFSNPSTPSPYYENYMVTSPMSSGYQEKQFTEKRLSSQNLEQWMKYAGEFGNSSENIAKPFLKEMEICHGRRGNVRAPRLTASTSNLNSKYNMYDDTPRGYDQNKTSSSRRDRYQSCHSMIDQTPITQYVTPQTPKRSSLPREIHIKQLDYIKNKEKELNAEFERLENDRRQLIEEMEKMQFSNNLRKDSAQYHSCQLPTLTEEESFRQQMHDEWLSKIAEREERRLHKIIKISKPTSEVGGEAPHQPLRTSSSTQDISDEFLRRVKERRSKLHIPSDSDWESGAESQPTSQEYYQQSYQHHHHHQNGGKPNNDEQRDISVKVLEGQKEADLQRLPKHLREFAADFISQIEEEQHQENTSTIKKSTKIINSSKDEPQPVMFAPKFNAKQLGKAAWSPGTAPDNTTTHTTTASKQKEQTAAGPTTPTPPTPPPLPVWSPQPSPPPGRKEFRPVRFTSPVLPRRYVRQDSAPVAPPWSESGSRPSYQSSSCSNINTIGTDKRVFSASSSTSIGQRIRDSPFLKGTLATEPERPKPLRKDDSSAFSRSNEAIYSFRNEYMSEPESEFDRPRKMAQLGRQKVAGIGPTTKDGMPIVLRSEVKENDRHQWYQRMYNTLHKAKDGDEYVTIRYKCPRGRYPYKSNGYMSEPEPNYDSDYSTMKYHTLDRRRTPSAGGAYHDDRNYGTMPNPVKPGSGTYKNQPGRIEDYVTGHSSVSDKEKKEWWDEVMEIFNGWVDENSSLPLYSIKFAREVEKFHLEQQKLSTNYTEGYLSRALKEQGYESDSNLVFRKKEESQFAPLSPVEQKQAYRIVQAGGEPPLQGFRKPAPEKPKEAEVVPPLPPTKGVPLIENGLKKESPHRYFETDVNIHYKTPIRYEYKEAIPEEELARRQAEAMKKLYQEERRRKYLQELQDMNSRRHTDNFTPSQKSPIPLNRYDDFNADISPKSPGSQPYPRTVARALYNFQGQTARELTFKKGDVIYIRRQIDKNWYEGEHNAMIGLLPANYVEIITKDGVRQPPKKPSEGQARAKFNFQAQSGIELSLNKGELVTLTRRVDENWFEGKIANRKGIFPVSYVEVLTDIGAEDYSPTQSKPVGAPASHSLITYPTPSLDTLRTNLNNEFNTLTNGHSSNGVLRETKTIQKTEVLHVDTNSEPIAYRALYKYHPQNNDELELQEGDIVYVLEKCDDGWYVGTSQRTGYFGTFPGNYVERV